MNNEITRAQPHVVIVGGGFGGLTAAQSLAHLPVRVTLIDRTNHHLFQPLLYQVATDVLARTEVGHALRDLFHDQPNARVHQAVVTAIDLEAREVELAEMAPLTYDYLVLALGADRLVAKPAQALGEAERDDRVVLSDEDAHGWIAGGGPLRR